MADVSSVTQSPPAKRRKEPSPTTVASLDVDTLLEILLRLPSLATLIRAALTCRAWRRAVASSPGFRRRFREPHPAPLLGLFFEPPGVAQDPALPAFPSFVPARRRDLDLAAALRGGDFFLTSLQVHPDKDHCWDVLDSRGGYVLLENGDQQTLAVLNPLAPRSPRFFGLGNKDAFEGHRGYHFELNPFLLCSGEDTQSFKVLLLVHDESRVRVTVFSSGTGEWSIGPWVDVPQRPRCKEFHLNTKMQANGFMYWFCSNMRYMVTLDAATMEFSVEKLPRLLRYLSRSFVLGEMNNGTRCIVYTVDLTVGVLLRRTDIDGIEKWMQDRTIPLDKQLDRELGKLKDNYDELQVVAIRDGFAYLATSKKFHAEAGQNQSWFLSLCLETMELEKLFQRIYDTDVHPYVMAWPPSLVGNF
ncbi:hypothetical protein ACP70R_037236 [Stipagrostis hirtigluma subsp. patula]